MRSISLSRFNSIILSGILAFSALYFGKGALIPLFFGGFFAMLMNPVANRLEKLKVNRIFSTLFSVLLIVVISFLIVWLIAAQGARFSESIPQMEKKAQELITQAQDYISNKLDIPLEKQNDLIKTNTSDVVKNSGNFLKSMFSNITSFFADLVLIVVFMFLFLYQREKYESFCIKLVKPEHKDETRAMLRDISKVAEHYLVGRCISVIIFTVLFTGGFLIVGLQNAFLFGFISALLTIIPYVGSFLSGIGVFAIALLMDSTKTAIGALSVIIIVQAIDNYFIEPYVIGGEVNISAFFTILSLVIGGMLWGIAGMIMFIPLVGITKIVCDRVKELQPYGYLIGDQENEGTSARIFQWFKKVFGRK